MRGSHKAKFQKEKRKHQFDPNDDLRCKACGHQWRPGIPNNDIYPCLTLEESKEAVASYAEMLSLATWKWLNEEGSLEIVCHELDIDEKELESVIRDKFECYINDIDAIQDAFAFYQTGVPTHEVSDRIDRSICSVLGYIDVFQELSQTYSSQKEESEEDEEDIVEESDSLALTASTVTEK